VLGFGWEVEVEVGVSQVLVVDFLEVGAVGQDAVAVVENT
jgi:hypothetical protein